jgi:hypothetical protein
MSIPTLRAAKSNRILNTLPRAVLDRVLPDLDHRPLQMRQVIQPRGVPVEEVVFPMVGVASMISMGDSGDSVEVATIGCEGLIGLSVFLGGQSAAVEVFIQVPGEGFHMSAKAFEGHIAQQPTLVRTLLLYTQGLLTQVAQCSACNRHHPVVNRCARWLRCSRIAD